MNGQPMVFEFRRPAFVGWGFFVLAFIPLAIFFPLLVWSLLVSVSILISPGPARAADFVPSARTGLRADGAQLFRAPPLV